MVNPFKKAPEKSDALDEHHIILGNGIIEVVYNHSTKTVFMLDQSGSDVKELEELQAWYHKQGWFLHAVTVLPPTIINRDRQ